jgi:phosphopantothenoylcysteine synthetase/decarboxylase
VTPPPRLRVLITSGGTAEPIDGVRVLTNLSTGATGALMADHFAQAGHDVTLVRAQHAVAATAPVHEERFRSFADLGAILHRLLRESDFDAVIHAAAVSDFSPELVPDDGHAPLAARGKIDSSAPRLLRLRPNPKLLDTLRGASRNPRIQIVAFKLTDQAGTDEIALEVRQLFERAKPDLVVHNDLSRRGAAAFPATIHHPNQTATLCASRRDLAVELEWILAQRHQSFSPA